MNSRLGATYLGDGRCQFLVWAPRAREVEVRIIGQREQQARLAPEDRGYYRAVLTGIAPGAQYLLRLDREKERPDPASRYQPFGVHEPSQITDPHAFRWNDANWSGLDLEKYVLYELHVGTFTAEGTFEAIESRLDEIRSLGITALELMPVAQFPGDRNWGYDGVYPFAVQASYGGPEGLKRLINACHQREMAVVLDVVYNHLGPEGNYLSDYGPYFTDAYRTPWGEAINFDGAQSDEVVNFFVQNALYWLDEFHIDALRLDAIHGIIDRNARPFLELLASEVEAFAQNAGRKVFLIAESDLNDARFVLPRDQQGYGLHAQWSDDFHHAVHVLMTGEQNGYYQDFGSVGQLAKAFKEGYVYTGEYSQFRQRRHGNSSRDIDAQQLVVFTQNHDQVGNRILGERLSQLISFEALKVSAGLVVLSPFLPLIFMGEEYGEVNPFLYFTSHSDPNLIEAVRRGRKQEFAAFSWSGEPPDPQAESTFVASKLQHERLQQEPHRTLWKFYKELLLLRCSVPALSRLSKDTTAVQAFEEQKVLFLTRCDRQSQVFIVYNLGGQDVRLACPVPGGKWERLLDSSEPRWRGSGSTLPESLMSEGKAELALRSHSFGLFSRP
ncbi:MAG TPA: malto-oligosyltrehalose trehalohydrolase [Terriglobales bacterium]|nr:malto-oligosyltrehalose trehalohydrolase [Terriglobales bacterium]